MKRYSISHRPKGTSDRGDPVEIFGFNTPVGQDGDKPYRLGETKTLFAKNHKTNSLQKNAYHKITSVGRPILSGSRLVSFKYTPAREITSQASYRNNSPPPKKRRAFYVAGVMIDYVGMKLLRLGSAKAPIPGDAQGVATPWGCFFPRVSLQKQRNPN